MFIFLFFILFLLELDRYRYDVEIFEFYTNNLNDMAKSLINSWLLITNYNNYRFSLNLCPIHNKLSENHDKIQSELEDALNNYYIINPGIFDEELYQENENYGYYFLKYYGNIKTTILPTLNKIVKDNDKIHTCFLSIMDGPIDIPLHKGPYSGLLRYHYTLVSCDSYNDYLSVKNSKFFWKEKEGFFFFYSYPHHVKKNSNGLRISIICDIERELNFPFNLLNNYILNKQKTYDITEYLQNECIPEKKPRVKFLS